MKTITLATPALALLLLGSSCASKDAANESAKADEKPAVKVESESFAPSTNIRYYNMDSVMANYDLVKKFNEANLRTMTELQNAQRSREAELNRMAANIQQKVQSNGYLTEASYNADVAELNQKQQAAQNYLGSLQNKASDESLRQQQEFLDSLNNYLATYNKTRHYDAILIYSPGELFNPALDITDDIINGLNKAYSGEAPKADAKAAAKPAKK
jgi:outer membrane protein